MLTRPRGDIARRFMENILAYQYYRRRYYYDKRNSHRDIQRSNEEVSMFAPLGSVCYDTGILRVHKDIREILAERGAWVDFNKRTKP